VFLPQVLHAGQVSSVILGADQQLLFSDPCFFIIDVSEELVKDERLGQTDAALFGYLLDSGRNRDEEDLEL
jgi:hypothetical protein